MPTQNQNESSQFCLRALLIFLFLVALCVGIFVAGRLGMKNALHTITVGETGPIEARELWPKPLEELVQDYPTEISQQSLKVYCMCQGFDPEYVWRMEGDQRLMERLIQKWKLEQAKMPATKIFMGRSHNSGLPVPDWWKPQTIEDVVYYVCPATVAGDKGDRFQVAFSEQENKIYVHYWFNF